jgi:hypothetical protein
VGAPVLALLDESNAVTMTTVPSAVSTFEDFAIPRNTASVAVAWQISTEAHNCIKGDDDKDIVEVIVVFVVIVVLVVFVIVDVLLVLLVVVVLGKLVVT